MGARRCSIALLVAVLAGCSGSTASSDASDAGGGGASSDAPSGDGGDAGSCISDPTIASVDATGTYRFVLTNAASSDRWIVTSSDGCAAFTVSGAVTMLGFQCACECREPARSAHFTRVAPGASLTVEWDGRELATYFQRFECATVGWPGLGCGALEVAAPRPVAAGDHEVTFVVATELPTALECNVSGEGFDCSARDVTPTQALCDSTTLGSLVRTTTASVHVSGPPAGSVTVPVSVQ